MPSPAETLWTFGGVFRWEVKFGAILIAGFEIGFGVLITFDGVGVHEAAVGFSLEDWTSFTSSTSFWIDRPTSWSRSMPSCFKSTTIWGSSESSISSRTEIG